MLLSSDKGKVEKISSRQKEEPRWDPGTRQVRGAASVGRPERASEGAGWVRGKAGNAGWCHIRKGLIGNAKDLGMYPKAMKPMELEADVI